MISPEPSKTPGKIILSTPDDLIQKGTPMTIPRRGSQRGGGGSHHNAQENAFLSYFTPQHDTQENECLTYCTPHQGTRWPRTPIVDSSSLTIPSRIPIAVRTNSRTQVSLSMTNSSNYEIAATRRSSLSSLDILDHLEEEECQEKTSDEFSTCHPEGDPLGVLLGVPMLEEDDRNNENVEEQERFRSNSFPHYPWKSRNE